MILLMLAVLGTAFWLTGIAFKVLGKLIGFIVCTIGYVVLAVLFFGIIGAALFGLPILIFIGLFSIVVAALR